MPMAIFGELRKRARHIAAPVLGVCLVGYFLYHTVQGERGIRSFLALQSRLREAEAMAAVTEAERLTWEHRVRLLRPASLDADLLDEQARRMLNVGRADEVVVLRPWGKRQAADSEH